MALDFPISPSVGQIYSYNGYTWEYNGSYWKSISTNYYLSLSGGTVTGDTIFLSGLTANTISATTYQNLPVSGLTEGSNISITGSNGNFTVSFTGTTGSNFTGGTVSGPTNFTNGLTANTISATTYQNLPIDIRVTGATYSNNTFTYRNNTGGTFDVSFNTVTGLTVNGNFSVTGGTLLNTLSISNNLNVGSTLTVSNNASLVRFTGRSEVISYVTPSSVPLSFIGSGGNFQPKLQGSYLYTCDSSFSNFIISDISNPNSPSIISTTSIFKDGFQPSSIDVKGRYAYIAYQQTGVTIVDIENVKSPIVVYTASTQSSGESIYVQGTFIYTVSGNDSRLFIHDLSVPTNPTLVSSLSTIYVPRDVYVQGNYAYIVGGFNPGAIQIIDISKPSSPTVVGSGTTSGSTPTSIYVQGRYAYVTNVNSNSFCVIDVSNTSSPSVTSLLTVPNARDVYVQGNYAFVTSNGFPFNVTGVTSQISIINITNPSSTSIENSFTNGSDNTSNILVQGKYCYVSGAFGGGTYIFDLGSSYIQQLEAGGIETTTLTTLSNAIIGNDLTVVGGMNVNQSLNVQGDISARTVRVLPSQLTVNSISANTDASLSSTFTLTLTGNTLLTTPTNGYPGQRLLYQLKQDGSGNRTLTLSSGFRSGPITVTLSTAANTTDYLGVIYNAIDNNWDVLALNKGYS